MRYAETSPLRTSFASCSHPSPQGIIWSSVTRKLMNSYFVSHRYFEVAEMEASFCWELQDDSGASTQDVSWWCENIAKGNIPQSGAILTILIHGLMVTSSNARKLTPISSSLESRDQQDRCSAQGCVPYMYLPFWYSNPCWPRSKHTRDGKKNSLWAESLTRSPSYIPSTCHTHKYTYSHELGINLWMKDLSLMLRIQYRPNLHLLFQMWAATICTLRTWKPCSYNQHHDYSVSLLSLTAVVPTICCPTISLCMFAHSRKSWPNMQFLELPKYGKSWVTIHN